MRVTNNAKMKSRVQRKQRIVRRMIGRVISAAFTAGFRIVATLGNSKKERVRRYQGR
jgi:hypothetical protein